MDEFTERLSRLAELSPDELDALEVELVAAFDAADASADIEVMQQVADALDEVRGEKANRTGEEAEAEVEPEAVAPDAVPVPASAVTAEPDIAPAPEASDAPVEEPAADEPNGDEPAPEVEPEAESEAPADAVADAPVEVAEVIAEADPEPEPTVETEVAEDPTITNPTKPTIRVGDTLSESEEPVAAEITADEVPEEHSPDAVAASVPFTIRAGGDIPGTTSGAELADLDAVADAMAKKIDTMRGVRGNGEQIVVASIRNEEAVPENRILRLGDAFGNARKIRDLITDKEQLKQEALVAAAWCAPRAPIYDVPTMGTTRRPVRDGVPTFTADRGGVVWMEPPAFPDLAGALSMWRHDGSSWEAWTDPRGLVAASPATEKPCLDVPCGDEQTADLDALPLCLCFDNLTARAFPEWIRANTDLTMIAQARFGEQVMLSQMFAVASTGTCGTVETSVGVARDFLSTVRLSAAQLRWRLRLDVDAPLQLVVPAWIASAIAIDLGLQQPGDDTLVTSTSEVNGYFGEFNVTPLWYIDDVPGTSAFTSCAAFPTSAHWLLYPTGAFVRLDNGELNLGIVRTKEDVQQNKYCEFVETFERTVYMGPSISGGNGWVVRGLTTVDIKGSHSGPTSIS